MTKIIHQHGVFSIVEEKTEGLSYTLVLNKSALSILRIWTKTAWDYVIQKWETIVWFHENCVGVLNDTHGSTCAFCIKDSWKTKQPFCEECPIRETTCSVGCRATAYNRYHNRHNVENARAMLDHMRVIRTAWEEGRFLVDPDEEVQKQNDQKT
jgi:hypothetical protein